MTFRNACWELVHGAFGHSVDFGISAQPASLLIVAKAAEGADARGTFIVDMLSVTIVFLVGLIRDLLNYFLVDEFVSLLLHINNERRV